MRTAPLLVLCSASLVLAPAAAAAGFFDSLFGLTPPPAPPPAAALPTAPGPTYRTHRRVEAEPREPRRREHRRVVAAAPKQTGEPQLQRTTGLMNDRTLRPGDAVMTRDGLRIFAGNKAEHHEAGDFVPLRAARHEGSRKARAVLVAIDEAAHLDVGRRRADLLTGRSVSRSDTERRPSFTDPAVSVRYVGP